MALIKCEECGKEFSDKASACPNCACPINVIEKTKENKLSIENKKSSVKDEKIVSKIIIDKDRINKLKKILNISYITIGICIYIIIGISDSYVISHSSIEVFLSLVVFYFLPFGIIVLLLNKKFKKSLSNTIVLTNKRIRGNVNTLLSLVEIDFPLNKINSIIVTHLIFNITGLSISSSMDKTRHLRFIKNASDFREKTIEEIEKYKNK